MAVEIHSDTFSILPADGKTYTQTLANLLEEGWDVLSTVPFKVENGTTTQVFVTFARDLEDDEELDEA